MAMLLTSQEKVDQAEACLSDAITTTVPAFRLLSDIATSNQQFGRAAGIAEIIETLLNNGDSKLCEFDFEPMSECISGYVLLRAWA